MCSIYWTKEKPIEPVFYYYETDSMRSHDCGWVTLVQVSKFKNKSGFWICTVKCNTTSNY